MSGDLTTVFQPVNSVVIVGAGSAGWLTALVLVAYCPGLKIRLVRPRANNPIGVGESTQPDLPLRVQAAGLDLADFCVATDATIKCGIFYRDWNVVGDHYWHPFSTMADTGPYTAAHHYQQLILEKPQQHKHADYYARVHTSYETCVKRNLIAPEAATALHVDAAKLALYLERRLTSVEVIESDRVEPIAADGRIAEHRARRRQDDHRGSLRRLHGLRARGARQDRAQPASLHYEANVNRAVAGSVPYARPQDGNAPVHAGARARARLDVVDTAALADRQRLRLPRRFLFARAGREELPRLLGRGANARRAGQAHLVRPRHAARILGR